MDLSALQNAITDTDPTQFDALALQVFRYQSLHCEVYRRFLEFLQIDASKIEHADDIPFLPIEFFKQFEVRSSGFVPEAVFESSSTTGTGVSRHYVKDLALYTRSFCGSFGLAFGDHRRFSHLALLPSYLERQNSSLVYQVAHFIRESDQKNSAFYLHDHRALEERLRMHEAERIPTILWGVSYALLDFAEQHPLHLQHTRVIETGGMKGRRRELTRQELHERLQKAFGCETISGEYGMTELMSQAYALKDGLYRCPPWMRVSAREINDPLSSPVQNRHGALNISDLANLHSCAFIASADLGRVFSDGSFEVLGRIDHSDTRGCNLLV